MTEPTKRFDDADLESALVDLRAHIEYPREPDLAPRVRREIETASRRSRPWWRVPRGQALGVAFAVAVLVAAALLTLSPATRTAVARFLGIGGVRIEFGDRKRSPSPETPAGIDLFLGRRTTLEEARRLATFPILKPPSASVGDPDMVYVASAAPGPRVSLVYRAGGRYRLHRLPRQPETGFGMVLTQFEAPVQDFLIKKLVGQGATVEPAKVHQQPAYWVRGRHLVYPYQSSAGLSSAVRLAGNTLLWERDGVTFRLESGLDKAEALLIAESIG